MAFPAIEIQCVDCTHLVSFTPELTGGFCDAFGDLPIPRPILFGDHDHTEPYEGDNGITFEPVPSVEEAISQMQDEEQ